MKTKVPNDVVNIKVSTFRRIVVDIIISRLSITASESRKIFDQFLNAELAGKKTHGFVRIPWLLQKGIKGHVAPVKMTSLNFATYFDCSNSIGYLAAEDIIQFLKLNDGNKLFQVVVGQDIFPTGILGSYAKSLMKDNLVCIFGTTPKLVKFKDGKNKMFGTNPVAIGYEVNKNLSFLADFTTAQSSFGDLLSVQYGLGSFDRKKYQTSSFAEPRSVNELFNGNQFTGSILQNVSNKLEIKQYLTMFIVQLLTELISQRETKKGDLVFVTVRKEMFGKNSVQILNKIKDMPEMIPGMRSGKIKKLKEVSISKKLLEEIDKLRSS